MYKCAEDSSKEGVLLTAAVLGAMMCGIFRLTLVKRLNSTDSGYRCYIDFLRHDLSQLILFCPSAVLPSVLLVLPPALCRALVLQTLRKFRGETPPAENVQNLAWGIAIKGLPVHYIGTELTPKRLGFRRVARFRKGNISSRNY